MAEILSTLQIQSAFTQITSEWTLSKSKASCPSPHPGLSSPPLTWIYECFFMCALKRRRWVKWPRCVSLAASSGGSRGGEAGVDEGAACGTMPNQPFSPGSRLSVWVHGAPCHGGLAHSGAQCPCQSRQHFLPLLAPALAGIHNISQLATMACLPAPTIWLLWATILTHITNYSKSRGNLKEGWRKEGEKAPDQFSHCLMCIDHTGTFSKAQDDRKDRHFI